MGPRNNISCCCWVTSYIQEACRSQDSLYKGQIQKLLQCRETPYQQIPLVKTIQKTYSFTYLWLLKWLLKKRSKVKFLALQGSNRYKCPEPLYKPFSDPQASCTGCNRAAIWNIVPGTHTNIIKLWNLAFLFSWINVHRCRLISWEIISIRLHFGSSKR